MFTFWHFLFTLILAVGLVFWLNLNPSHIFLPVIVFAGLMPDVDHLLCWDPVFLSRIFPARWWGQGLAWMPRIDLAVSALPLHLWMWPSVLVLAAGILVKRYPSKMLLAKALFSLAIGWGCHLAMDGVLVII
ncbi:hypothetical protein MUP05_06290 [Candidatus Bathyarchaeota archaeon]|nr:hypothetical protein [Candidatus Bathyarchaeota archaeon]